MTMRKVTPTALITEHRLEKAKDLLIVAHTALA
jgi:hypothetical protein